MISLVIPFLLGLVIGFVCHRVGYQQGFQDGTRRAEYLHEMARRVHVSMPADERPQG